MKLKRIIASLVSVSMLTGMLALPNSAFADDEDVFDPSEFDLRNSIFEYDDTRADIVFDYLGLSDSYDISGLDTSAFDPEHWPKDKYMWIGVSVENTDRIPSGVMNGLSEFQAGLVYDGRYLSLDEAEIAGSMFTALDTLNEADTLDPYYAITDSYDDEFDYEEHLLQDELYSYPDNDDTPIGGNSPLLEGLTVLNEDDEYANVLRYTNATLGKIGTAKYILNTANDSSKHLLLLLAYKVLGDESPNEGGKFIQHYADVGTAVATKSYSMQYQMYSEADQLGDYFNIVDNVGAMEQGFGTDKPEPVNNASVSPQIVRYDHSENGTYHKEENSIDRAIKYTKHDGGEFQQISIDGFEDIDHSDDYETAPLYDDTTDEVIGTIVTIKNSLLEKLVTDVQTNHSGLYPHQYTATFIDDNSGKEGTERQTATIEIYNTPVEITFKVKTEVGEGYTGSQQYSISRQKPNPDFATDPDADETITEYLRSLDGTTDAGTEVADQENTKQYTIEAGDTYTISVPAATGTQVNYTVDPVIAAGSDSAFEVYDDAETGAHNADISLVAEDDGTRTVVIKFGEVKPTLDISTVTNGSIEVYAGTSATGTNLNDGSGSIELTAGQEYTVKAVPSTADANKKYAFAAWDEASGDTEAPSAARLNNDTFTFTATTATASTIGALFSEIKASKLTLDIKPDSSVTDADELEALNAAIADGVSFKLREGENTTTGEALYTFPTSSSYTYDDPGIWEYDPYTLEGTIPDGYRIVSVSGGTLSGTNIALSGSKRNAESVVTITIGVKEGPQAAVDNQTFDLFTDTTLEYTYTQNYDDYAIGNTLTFLKEGETTPITFNAGTDYTLTKGATDAITITKAQLTAKNITPGKYTVSFNNASNGTAQESIPTLTLNVINSEGAGIWITSFPKLEYTHGEELDLHGTVVKVGYPGATGSVVTDDYAYLSKADTDLIDGSGYTAAGWYKVTEADSKYTIDEAVTDITKIFDIYATKNDVRTSVEPAQGTVMRVYTSGKGAGAADDEEFALNGASLKVEAAVSGIEGKSDQSENADERFKVNTLALKYELPAAGASAIKTKTYDGTTNTVLGSPIAIPSGQEDNYALTLAAGSALEPNGLVAGDGADTVTAAIASAAFDDENANQTSTDKRTVTVTGTLSGANSKNYTFTPIALEDGTINKAELVIKKINDIPSGSVGNAVAAGTEATSTVTTDRAATTGAYTESTIYPVSSPKTLTLHYTYSYEAPTASSDSHAVTIGANPTVEDADTKSNYTVTIEDGQTNVISDKNVESVVISIKDNPTKTFNYSEDSKLNLEDLSVEVKYEGEDAKTYAYTPADGTTPAQWKAADGTTIPYTSMPISWKNADGDTTPVADGEYVSPYKVKTDGPYLYTKYVNRETVDSAHTVTANPKEVSKANAPIVSTWTVVTGKSGDKASAQDKVYDGNKNVSDVTDFGYAAIPASELVSADRGTLTGDDDSTVRVKVGSGEYTNAEGVAQTDVNDPSTPWTIKYTAAASRELIAVDASGNKITGNSIALNYKVKESGITVADGEGNITKKRITLTSISNITPADQYVDSTKSQKDHAASTATNDASATENKAVFSGVVSGDTVEVKFVYDYGNLINNPSLIKGSNTVTLNYGADFADADVPEYTGGVQIKSVEQTADTAGYNNYELDTSVLASASYTGTVRTEGVEEITLTFPDGTATQQDQYKYNKPATNDNKLNINGAVVTVTYSGERANDVYTAAQPAGTDTVTWTVKTGNGAETPTTDIPFEIYWYNNTSKKITNTTITPNEDLVPSTHNNLSLTVKHTSGVESESVTKVYVEPKILDVFQADSSADLDKVYNNSTALLDSSTITYKVGYSTEGDPVFVEEDDSGNKLNPSATAAYSKADAHAYGTADAGADYTIALSNIKITTNGNFSLPTKADGSLDTEKLTVINNLKGTISPRPITISVNEGTSVDPYTVLENPTAEQLAVTLQSKNYTVSLDGSPVNGSETNALVPGDNTKVEITAAYADRITPEQDIAVSDENIKLVKTTASGADNTGNYKVTKKTGNVKGSIVRQTRTMTFNADNATVKVYEGISESEGTVTYDTTPLDPTRTGGKIYTLEESTKYPYKVEVTPADGYAFVGWSNAANLTDHDTFKADGMQSPSASSVEFKMGAENKKATAIIKKLPEWEEEPSVIDRSQDFELKTDGDYNPTEVEISYPDGDSTKTLKFTPDGKNPDGTDADGTFTVKDGVITIPAKSLSNIPDLSGEDTANGAQVKVTFDVEDEVKDALNDDDTQVHVLGPETVAVTNNAASETKLASITYDHPENGYTYGDTLNYSSTDGGKLSFTLETTKTNDPTTVKTYSFTDKWVYTETKKDPDSGEIISGPTEPQEANLLQDGITLSWDDSKAGAVSLTNAAQTLKPSIHDGNSIAVTYNKSGSSVQTLKTEPFEVKKKDLTVTVTGAGITKTYDGTDTISDSELSKVTVTVAGGEADNITLDSITSANYVALSGTRYVADGNADDNKTVRVSYKLKGDNLAEYKTPDFETLNTSDSYPNYDVKGAITAKPITISEVRIPDITAASTNKTSGRSNLVKDDWNEYLSFAEGSDIRAEDKGKIKFSFFGQYEAPATELGAYQFELEELDGNVTNPSSGKYKYEVVTDDQTAKNYSFTWPQVAQKENVTGNVVKSLVTDIRILTQPEQAQPTETATGDTFSLKGLVVEITYEGEDDGTQTIAFSSDANPDLPSEDWINSGLTVSWTGDNAQTAAAPVSGTTALKKSIHDGAAIKVSKSGKSKPTNAWKVNAKELEVTVSGTDITKVYDGTDALGTDTKLTVSFTDASKAVVGEDSVYNTDNIVVTAKYSDIHADTDTSAANSLTVTGVAWKGAASTGGDYTIKLADAQAAIPASITPRPVTISKLTVPYVFENSKGSILTKNVTGANINDKDTVIVGTGEGISSDTITLSYTAVYTAEQVAAPAQEVTLPLSAEPTVTITSTKTDEALKSKVSDYAFTFPENAIGQVKAKELSEIQIRQKPTKIDYTHGDELDLTGMSIAFAYTDREAAADVYTFGADAEGNKGWLDSEGTLITTLPLNVKTTWSTGTQGNPAADSIAGAKLAYTDEHFTGTDYENLRFGTVVVSDGTNAHKNSVELSIKRLPVTLTLEGNIEKVYNRSTAVSSETTFGEKSETSSADITYEWSKDLSEYPNPIAIDEERTLASISYPTANVHEDGTPAVNVIYTPTNDARNYNITLDTSSLKTTINPQPITIKFHDDVYPSLVVGDDKFGTSSVIDKTGYELLEGTIYGSDNVRVTYTYDLEDTLTAGDKNFAEGAESVVNVNNDAVSKNYTVTADPRVDHGKVANKKIRYVIDAQIPKTNYVHGETIDFTDSVIQIAYTNGKSKLSEFKYQTVDGDSYWYETVNVKASDGTITEQKVRMPENIKVIWAADDMTINSPKVDTAQVMRYDDENLDSNHNRLLKLVYYNEDENPVFESLPVIHVDQKPITYLHLISQDDITKPYDGTKEISGTPTVNIAIDDPEADDTAIVGADNVAVTYDLEYSVPNAGNDIPLTLKNAALTGAQAGNYKLSLTPGKELKDKDGADTNAVGDITAMSINVVYVPAPAIVAMGAVDISAGDPRLQKTAKDVKIAETADAAGATDFDDEYIHLDAASFAAMPEKDRAAFAATYTVEYAPAHVTGDGVTGQHEKIITGPAVTIKYNGAGDDVAANYNIIWPTESENKWAKGIVVPNTVNISDSIFMPKMTYTHGDELEFDGMQFTIRTETNLRTFVNIDEQWYLKEADLSEEAPDTLITDPSGLTAVTLAAKGVSLVIQKGGTEYPVGSVARRNVHHDQKLYIKAASTDDNAVDGYVWKEAKLPTDSERAYHVDRKKLTVVVKADKALDKTYDKTTGLEYDDIENITIEDFYPVDAELTDANNWGKKNPLGDVIEFNKDDLGFDYEDANVAPSTILDAGFKNIVIDSIDTAHLSGAHKDNYEIAAVQYDQNMTAYTDSTDPAQKDTTAKASRNSLQGKIWPAPLSVYVKSVPRIYTTTADRTFYLINTAEMSDEAARNAQDNTTTDNWYFEGIIKEAAKSSQNSAYYDEVHVAYISYEYPDSNDNTRPTIDITDDDFDTAGSGINNYKAKIYPMSVTGIIVEPEVASLKVTGDYQTDGYIHRDRANLTGLTIEATLNDELGTVEKYAYVNDPTRRLEGWVDITDNPDKVKDGRYTSDDVMAVLPHDIYVDWVLDPETADEQLTDEPSPILYHDKHDGAKLKAQVYDKDDESRKDEDGYTYVAPAYSEKALSVAPQPLYVKAAIKNRQNIYKIYSENRDLEADDQTIDNITKIDYTFYLRDNDESSLFDPADYDEDVKVDAEHVKGYFENGNVIRTYQGFVIPEPLKKSDELETMAVNYNNPQIGSQAVELTNVALIGADSPAGNGNYVLASKPEDAEATEGLNAPFVSGNTLAGKVFPRETKITPVYDAIDPVWTDATQAQAERYITDWNYDPALINGDKITISNWLAYYSLQELADGKAVITPTQPDGVQLSGDVDNYDITFDLEPFEFSEDAHKKLDPTATGLKIDKTPAFFNNDDTVHGDTIGDAGGWDGLEFTVTTTSGNPTHHKRENGTWVNNGYYTVPENTEYIWNGTPVDFDDPASADIVLKRNETNKLEISKNASAHDEAILPAEKIGRKPITISLTADHKITKVYDGADKTAIDLDANSINIVVNGALEGDTVTFETKPEIAYKTDGHVEVAPDGTYAKDIEITGDAVLDDAWDQIYDLKTAETSLEIQGAITPKTITAAITAPDAKALDESTRAVSSAKSITFDGVVEPDEVELSFAAEYEDLTKSADPATLKFTTDPTITGKDKAVTDYTLGTVTITGKVLAADATVPPTATEPPYTPGATDAPGATTSPAATSAPRTSSGGSGGGNSLTIRYKNEDGTQGTKVSSNLTIDVADGPIEVMGVFSSRTMKDTSITWTSSDESVATVDENGVITPIAPGKATITAQSNSSKSLKSTINLTVTQKDPSSTPVPGATTAPSDTTPSYTKGDSLITKDTLNPYIAGYDDYVFGPELPISREELSAIFARLITNSMYMDGEYPTSFEDVPEGWSRDYIGFVESKGIVTGYEDGTFRPYNKLTRAEMAVMMAKAEGYDLDADIDVDDISFPDIDDGYKSWAAAKAIKILSDTGVMTGYEDGTFRPGNQITRAETVATVNRVLAAMDVAELEITPSDMTSAHWAYDDVVLSMNHRILKDVAIDSAIWDPSLDADLKLINSEDTDAGAADTADAADAADADAADAADDTATE